MACYFELLFEFLGQKPIAADLEQFSMIFFCNLV